MGSGLNHRIISDIGGNTVMIFALLLIPLCAVAGFAIDYNRSVTARGHIQAAVDASALAAARALEDSALSDPEIVEIAERMFEEDMATSARDLDCPLPVVTIDHEAGTVGVRADCVLPTTLSSILSVDEVTIGDEAIAKASLTKLDLALMLDVSGSMGGQKLVDLKTAAKDAAAQLITDSTGDRVRIAFNTYSTSINAGIYGPDVLEDLDEDDLAWIDEDGDGVFDDDEQAIACVSERTGLFAWKANAPGNNRWLGDAASACPASSVLPLTSSLDTFNTEIDALSAGGYTAGHLGVAWSWYLIAQEWASIWPTESEPLSNSDPHGVKSVILMTDGQFNTQYEPSQGDSAEQAMELCDAMRAAGIIIYAVAFQAPSSAEATLKDCAGDDSRFYDASNGDELQSAYSSIASQLAGLALVH